MAKTMKLNHLNLAIGDYFGLQEPPVKGRSPRQQICRKASKIGYIVVGEEVFGEFQFTPDNDRLIVPIASTQAPELDRRWLQKVEDVEVGQIDQIDSPDFPITATQVKQDNVSKKATKKAKKAEKKQEKKEDALRHKAAKKAAKALKARLKLKTK